MLNWIPQDWNVSSPLTEGTFFWTDQLWRGGYRLQSHCAGESWRVVCPRGMRQTTGSEATCLEAFDRLAGPPLHYTPGDHIVVLLHGLLRTRRCMKPLGASLTKVGLGPVIRPDYASSRLPIRAHAAALRRLVDGLAGEPKLSFVGHSMGNIVLRHAIGDWIRDNDPRGVLKRMRRVVMLGPPNQGAAIARQLSRIGLFHLVAGDGGMELGPDWESLRPRLATPPCPFAVVAGDLTPYWANNPLIQGANDFLVSVDEAKLPGASDFVTMHIPHATLMYDARVHKYVIEFIDRDDPAAALPTLTNGTRIPTQT
jgi:hypothetical protein